MNFCLGMKNNVLNMGLFFGKILRAPPPTCLSHVLRGLPRPRFQPGGMPVIAVTNPVGGVIRREPSSVTEHRHLALNDQLRDVFHGRLLQ